MITFDRDTFSFTYRVAGVFVDQDRVLLQQFENVDWWCLPGGRVELGEQASIALQREMEEEIGCHVAVGRLLWVAENFYPDGDSGRTQHEIGLYFEAALSADFAPAGRVEFLGSEGDMIPTFRWFPLAGIGEVKLLPAFLRQALNDLPTCTTHIVNREQPRAS